MNQTVNDPATDTKSRILAAASALFLEGGAKALSVRAVAARAGLSTIGIYSHFNGKQGVLDALYIEGFGLISQPAPEGPDIGARQAVLTACRRYLDAAERHEAHYLLIFGEADPNYEPSEEARKVAARAFVQMAADVARLLPPDAPLPVRQDAALQVWSLLHGAVSLRRHAVAGMVPMEGWQARTMTALEHLIDGITAA